MIDSDVVATGIVFYSDPEEVVKVHNEDLSKDNYRVMVKYAKKPAVLVPVPVPKSDIEIVKDAVGTFVQWPKKLVLISNKVCVLLYSCYFVFFVTSSISLVICLTL